MSHLGQLVLVSVVVGPSRILGHLVVLVGALQLLLSLLVLVVHGNLVCLLVCLVGSILRGPQCFLVSIELAACLVVAQLLCQLGLVVSDLVRAGTFKSIGAETLWVRGMESSLRVLSHDVRVVRGSNLSLVLCLLILSPLLVSVSLLLCLSLVELLHLLHHFLTLLSGLVFQHAAHTSD